MRISTIVGLLLRASRRPLALAIFAGMLFPANFAQAAATGSPALTGAAARGRDLFTGTVKFKNGGPACIVCHSTAGVPFLNGGAMGPSLSGLYSKVGPVGTKAILQTLYFPTMVPIYSKHQVEPAEQADLLAFFQATADLPKPPETNGTILGIAIAGAILFVILTAFFWRKRVLGVREAMVRRAAAAVRAGRQGAGS